MFDNWRSIGTVGYISPGIISRENYKTADVWSLLIVLHVSVEGLLVFVDDKDTMESRENFALEGTNGSMKFKSFVTNMLKNIFDGNFTHEKLLKSLRMKK